MKMIAAGLGITPAALYWHFPSKAAILSAFIHTEGESFITEVETASVGGLPSERLGQFVREHVKQSIARVELGPFGANYGIQQLAKFLPAAEQAEIKLWMRRHTHSLASILRAGIEEGGFRPVDITATSNAILTMCGYLTSWYKPGGRLSPEEVAAQHAELALAMVALPEPVDARIVSGGVAAPRSRSARSAPGATANEVP